MDSQAVINASPLIFFSRGRQMELLHHFANHLLVPEPVATEIRRRGLHDPTVQILDHTAWIEIVAPPSIPENILEWGLGMGESAVLAYAYVHPNVEAIIDDLAGRKCTTCLNIPVRGTLGIVLIAKQRGLIPAARPVIEELLRSGLYLSSQILDEALKRVGE